MPEVTQEMWDAVLLHWERLVLNPWVDVTGSTTCVFCQTYHGASRASCGGCPVKESTGLSFCCGTPYGGAFRSHQSVALPSFYDSGARGIYSTKNQRAIWAEYKFLVRLYRKWQRKKSRSYRVKLEGEFIGPVGGAS